MDPKNEIIEDLRNRLAATQTCLRVMRAMRAERDGAIRTRDEALRELENARTPREISIRNQEDFRACLQKALEQRDALSEKANHFEICLQKAHEELTRVNRSLNAVREDRNKLIDREKQNENDLLSSRAMFHRAEKQRDGAQETLKKLLAHINDLEARPTIVDQGRTLDQIQKLEGVVAGLTYELNAFKQENRELKERLYGTIPKAQVEMAVNHWKSVIEKEESKANKMKRLAIACACGFFALLVFFVVMEAAR